EGGALSRTGQRVSVLAHQNRAVDLMRPPVLADCLSDGENVSFVKAPVLSCASMPAGAEAYTLMWIARIRSEFIELTLETSRVDQHAGWHWFSRQWMNWHLPLLRRCKPATFSAQSEFNDTTGRLAPGESPGGPR